MLRRFFLVIGLGSLAVISALADIVNVSLNGSVSGYVEVTVGCAPVTPGCVQTPYGDFLTVSDSFSGTGSASGSAVDPFNSDISMAASADQSITATPDALAISMEGFISGLATGYSGANLNDSVAVSFTLTQESEVQLTDNPFYPQYFSNSGELLDSTGNVILVVPSFPSVSASTVLQPGTYQLDDSMVAFAPGNYTYLDEEFGLDMNASFTPVVPEPRWAILAPLLATMLGGFVVSRRRRL